ncbi:3-hydroxyacyl-CoA dehydrogenase NAD-binding domain-containing protein [Ruegeria arenilitoris]|uniref:3-hydroxyacyl-CoA dehydrogenase NAD-binding domain-containing protein n=1 Tax=Ruegeria arenilitoris TaxID=1173585 RepID=UPI00147FA66D|nr:3-hydroxyacyl-CoA dehydrogenase NAD-binding domain-containing protein [Ruegeria arenilitoris]
MPDLISYELVHDDDTCMAVIAVNNPPVNALSHGVRLGLVEAIGRFAADGQAKIAVLVGAGRTFIAGADIKEFGKPLKVPDLEDVNAALDDLQKPIVCSLHGTALGGGFELALSCHYRVALDTARVGLPEVHLGLIPGAGGTQRLPRLTGIAAAADIVSTGRQVPANEALNLGIIDEIADGTDPRAAGIAFAKKLVAEGKSPNRIRDLTDKIAPDRDNAALFRQLIETARRKAKGQQSPVAAVESAIAAASLPFDQGLRQERQTFDALVETDQSKALIHAFFAEREVAKIPELAAGKTRDLNEAAVIGGGTMGSGIAMALLTAGFKVCMLERDQQGAERGQKNVQALLDGALKRGKISSERHAGLSNTAFSVTTDVSDLSDADVIIEAAFEDMDIKKSLFRQLDAHTKPDAILASNTSFLDIDEIASVTSRPANVLGLHFFSPAHIMKLLEIVVGKQTSPDVVATGFALAKRLKKVGVRAGVCDGFIGNRILDHYLDLVSNLVEDGTSPYAIDAAVTELGFPMGPHQMLDLAGLDIVYANRRRKLSNGWVGRYSADYMDQITKLERLGQKTGRGMYLYADGDRSGKPDKDVLSIIADIQTRKDIAPRSLRTEGIQKRYLAAMVNEGARILEEGVALRPLDIDMAMIFGFGFPRWRGGPMKYADLIGLDVVLADIRRFEEEDPDFWSPAKLLVDLAGRGQTFDTLNKLSQTK